MTTRRDLAGTTAALATRAKAGDREAAGRLFALAADRARLYVRLRLGPSLRQRVDVDDVLQDGWAEATRSLASFEPRGEGAFVRWLCRILENRIRDLGDRETARKRTPDAAFVRVSEIASHAAGPKSGAAGAAARAEEEVRLVRAVDALPDDEREVVLRRFFEHRTLDEIAALTGQGETTVRRLLGRALRRLGSALGDA